MKTLDVHEWFPCERPINSTRVGVVEIDAEIGQTIAIPERQ